MDALDYPFVMRLLAAAFAAVSAVGAWVFLARAWRERRGGFRLRTQLAAALGVNALAGVIAVGGFAVYLAAPFADRDTVAHAVEPFVLISFAAATVATLIAIRSVTLEVQGERAWLATVLLAALAVALAAF